MFKRALSPRRTMPSPRVRGRLALAALLGLSLAWASPAVHAAGETQLADVPAMAQRAADTVFVVYLPGSDQEFYADRCEPRSVGSMHGLPATLADLDGLPAGDGRRIEVTVYCTPSRIGTFDHHSGSGDPKIQRRARDLARLLDTMAAAGVPSEQVFVAGWSAGAWAALLAAAETPQRLNAVIAVAPAFAGPRAGRSAGWERLRGRSAAQIAQAQHLDALVYSFAGDSFERPADLRFLGAVPGVRLDEGVRRAGAACGDRPHLTAFAPCFRNETAAIADFIRDRLGGGAAGSLAAAE